MADEKKCDRCEVPIEDGGHWGHCTPCWHWIVDEDKCEHWIVDEGRCERCGYINKVPILEINDGI